MTVLLHLWPFVRLGLTDVWRHKTRSLLTMLGVVFGVASVIAMLAVGEGASQQALDSIKRLGSQNILLTSEKPSAETGGNVNAPQARLTMYGLLYEDEQRIRETIPGVELTVPARMVRRNTRFGERQKELRIVETIPEWFDVVQRPVTGRVLKQNDLNMHANVCVLTENGARQLLAGEEIISQRIRIGAGMFEVIGVIKNEDGGSIRAPDSEVDVYIPMTTGKKLFGDTSTRPTASGGMEGERVELGQIIVRMTGTDVVEAGSKAIESMLAHFHKKKDYRIDVPLALLIEAERTKRTFNIVLGAIAGISLLVGGIGIMNIMLASVTERTKEIGIRRAIGARRSRIVIQFLINTCVLSLGGGLVGLLLGMTIPFIITWTTDMVTVVQPYSLALAFCISAGIGIVFGLYPAMRAASLDPIEALRHE